LSAAFHVFGSKRYPFEEWDMHTVEIRLSQVDLRDKMNAMRTWLDERRFEPSTFASHANGGVMCLSVSFRSADEAKAFAAQFAGRVNSLPSTALNHIS
jgi:hypothetical protein